MPYFIFLWDDENERHVTAHGVTVVEFEEVVSGSWNTTVSRTSGRPISFGWTSTGRYLACAYEIIDEVYCYPVTAYEVDL